MRTLLVLILILSPWAQAQKLRGEKLPQVEAMTPEQAAKLAEQHVVRQSEMWARTLKRPLGKRLASASSLVNEYVILANRAEGFPPSEAANFGAIYRRVFAQIINRIPPELTKILKERLVGVFAVKNLGSTGFTEYVRDKNGQIVAAFIVLDIDAIKKSVNEWASEKDSSVFQKGDYKIKVKMVADNKNTAHDTMEMITLHEMAHVLAPFVAGMPHDLKSAKPESAKNPYIAMSWGDLKTAKFAGRPEGVSLSFYKPSPTTANTKIPEIYSWLDTTSFATLYSAIDPLEDFADSFASWVRTRKFGKAFSLSVTKKDQLVKTYLSCWNTPRCAEKAKFFENLWK